jgi:glycosyltransferase involved in cell wall biosynthesis
MSSVVTVCIATHKRPAGLERLLRSLAAQRGAPPFDVIVVDNDAAGSGKDVAERFRDRLVLSYMVEPVRGLARVRNRAVASAAAPFVAFIDDDEWAPPEWLASLHRVAVDFAADVVIGGVEQVFDADVADYIRACGLFDNPPRRDGAPVPWFLTRTSNALVRHASLPEPRSPFSTHFDLVGGEDLHLFRRMIDAGARVVAADTHVFEERPVSRANLRWVVRRAIRNGGTFGEVEWAGGAKRLRRLTTAAGVAARSAARVVALWHRDRPKAGRHIVRTGEEVGKMLYLTGIRIEEYRTHP